MNSVLRRTTRKFLTHSAFSPFSTSIRSLLNTRLTENPQKDAIRFENQNKTWTFKELDQHSNAFAYGLLELGYNKGDRILFWVDKNYTSEITVAQIGMAKIGVTLVPLQSSSGEDLKKALKESECRGVLFSANTKDEGKRRSDILNQALPGLEDSYPGSSNSFSEYPKLKHLVHVGFHTIPGTIKYRQLLVYGSPSLQTNKIPADVDAPLVYAKTGKGYKEYSLGEIEKFANDFRSNNQVQSEDSIAVAGCPYCPGTFASGAYQALANGNFVTLYGGESFKTVAEKLRAQQPSYVVVNQKWTDQDLKEAGSAESGERLKKVLVAGKDAGSLQNAFGGKSVSTFTNYWE